MGLARAIAFFTIAVSLLTFVAFFGRLPAFRLDVLLTHGRVTNGSSRLGHYLMHDKHPLVIIFFLGLVTLSALAFVPVVWEHLTLRHKLLTPLLLPQPYIFTYLSATRNADSYINDLNHAAHMRLYPYDRVLYYPGNTCSTCHFLKPARSKHCSICKTCVARMDHHCIWVNNCLGRGNYRWFLALLATTTILIAYAAYLAYIVISPLVGEQYTLYERWYSYVPGQGSDLNSWAIYLQMKMHYFLVYLSIYLDVGGLRASGVGLLALLTWPLPLGLLAYHVYLIWAGMTTNESAKWADWRDDMTDGVVFMGRRREDTINDETHSASSIETSAPVQPSRNAEGSAISSSSTSPISTPPETPPEHEEPPTTWPLESRHILIRTLDGQPPKNLPSRIKSVAAEGSFDRVWNLSVVENVYDLGFWDNILEALK